MSSYIGGSGYVDGYNMEKKCFIQKGHGKNGIYIGRVFQHIITIVIECKLGKLVRFPCVLTLFSGERTIQLRRGGCVKLVISRSTHAYKIIIQNL